MASETKHASGKDPRVETYEHRVEEIRFEFLADPRLPRAGVCAVRARSAAVDDLIRSFWEQAFAADAQSEANLALLATGGYGRQELLPHSDVDLLFLLEDKAQEHAVKEPIRWMTQQMWDAGLRVSPVTRRMAECERFDPGNVEGMLSLFDARALAGSAEISDRWMHRSLPKVIARDGRRIAHGLRELTAERHAKYGATLFHLEPNIKDSPGGLRDAHVVAWLAKLRSGASGGNASSRAGAAGGVVTKAAEQGLAAAEQDPLFRDARERLLLIRTFLHLRKGRDDNTLDWQAQDEAAAVRLGVPDQADGSPKGQGSGERADLDPSYWMRLYFRDARSIDRAVKRSLEEEITEPAKAKVLGALRRSAPAFPGEAFELEGGRLSLPRASPSRGPSHGHADGAGHNAAQDPTHDPAHDPEVMLAFFAAAARTGLPIARETERRLEDALPLLSAHLEDGPGLWRWLDAILTGEFAGRALRAMHALGILELVVPEFHGIDALVVRDAYHRYTVDEHTFVLIDALHALQSAGTHARFAGLWKGLPHAGLLLLAALLHDTGKGHTALYPVEQSVRMAESVTGRLQLDPYESNLVLSLVANQAEMFAALRRDVFDAETVRSFAARVGTPEALRMLTLLTFADLDAVHPDALTPWKADSLWQLHSATLRYLDRNLDEDRLGTTLRGEFAETVLRVKALLDDPGAELEEFLNGLPRRYLLTRTPETIRTHCQMAGRLRTRLASLKPGEDLPVELHFELGSASSTLTLVTRDRPMLFADVAGALAAWGMNIVTADAFSNASSLVVDSFRFTDTYRTLELNESERARFTSSISQAISGAVPVTKLMASRRRGRRSKPKVQVAARVDIDQESTSHATVVQVIAQDTHGLLRALAMTLANEGCDVGVALIDTEGDRAIDVFYITRGGAKLPAGEEASLSRALLEAVERNAV